MFNIFKRNRSEEVGAPSAGMTVMRRKDRSTDELIGICRGILADGHVSVDEAKYLDGWLARHSEFSHVYPFNKLIARLHEALVDGVLDADEEADLLEAISGLVGGEAYGDHGSESFSLSTALPLTLPAPAPLSYPSIFVVTGTFAYGTRAVVSRVICDRGGSVVPYISKKVGYLVVGDIGSRDWIHSSYGRKIEKAVEYAAQGCPIAIISEQHWTSQLAPGK
jgi:hypothetical protein